MRTDRDAVLIRELAEAIDAIHLHLETNDLVALGSVEQEAELRREIESYARLARRALMIVNSPAAMQDVPVE